MKKLILLILLSVLLSLFAACGEETEQEIDYSLNMNTEYPVPKPSGGTGERVPVILLLGQSNASGCSIVEYLKLNTDESTFEKYNNGFDDILINYCIDDHSFTSNGEFVAVNLECGCGEGFFGPEVGMAETLTESFPGQRFIILKYTMSGYSLAHHWLDEGQRGDIYTAFLKFAKTYMTLLSENGYRPTLECICWMQGESDTAEENALNYYDNQICFINYLREDLGMYNDDCIYFIDAGISQSPYCLPGYPTVNEAKRLISLQSDYNMYFSTIDMGLTTLYEPDYDPDLGHYDSLSEIKLGNTFGQYIAKALEDRYGEE